jgi:hypothetical protein
MLKPAGGLIAAPPLLWNGLLMRICCAHHVIAAEPLARAMHLESCSMASIWFPLDRNMRPVIFFGLHFKN